MSGLRRRLEDLEAKPQMQRPDEEFQRYKLAAKALEKEDRDLFHRFLDMIEEYPGLDRQGAALQATTEELTAYERLQALEALPLAELRELVGS